MSTATSPSCCFDCATVVSDESACRGSVLSPKPGRSGVCRVVRGQQLGGGRHVAARYPDAVNQHHRDRARWAQVRTDTGLYTGVSDPCPPALKPLARNSRTRSPGCTHHAPAGILPIPLGERIRRQLATGLPASTGRTCASHSIRSARWSHGRRRSLHRADLVSWIARDELEAAEAG